MIVDGRSFKRIMKTASRCDYLSSHAGKMRKMRREALPAQGLVTLTESEVPFIQKFLWRRPLWTLAFYL